MTVDEELVKAYRERLYYLGKVSNRDANDWHFYCFRYLTPNLAEELTPGVVASHIDRMRELRE